MFNYVNLIPFSFKQFKEWKFHLFGVGLFPRPIDAQRITTILGLQASVMIHFKNPTREAVSIDLILTSRFFFLHFVNISLFISLQYKNIL